MTMAGSESEIWELSITVELGNPRARVKCGRTRSGSDLTYVEDHDVYLEEKDLSEAVKEALLFPEYWEEKTK